MDRRAFGRLCSAILLLVAACPPLRAQETQVKRYGRAKLVDRRGEPIRASRLSAGAAYVFHYPYAGTPCLLINLGKPTATNIGLEIADGQPYVWPGGVGPQRAIIAFCAICPHQLSYFQARASVINYRTDRSAIAGRAQVIVCCAHDSIFEPAQGGRVIDGPAPQPLTGIALAYDSGRDELDAVGTYGAELFDDFFIAYKKELIEEYGPGKSRQPVSGTTVLLPAAEATDRQVLC
jgi:arsenite oxidase small subunit